jgi:hypothetical protein
MLVPQPEGEIVNFSLSEFSPQVFESLGDGFKNKIAKSPEFAELAAQQKKVVPLKTMADLDDDIPF